MKNPKVLIIDLGSQYSLLISRTLRELGVRSVVLAPARVEAWLSSNSITAVILSGGDGSVYDPSFTPPPRRILELGVPVLGICLGMHWLAKEFGGTVENCPDLAQYGPVKIVCDIFMSVFLHLPSALQEVYASHGDSVTRLPAEFERFAHTVGREDVQAFWHPERRIFGLQFHPEVVDTQLGKTMLANFVFSVCTCERDWKPADMIAEIREETLSTVGNERAILGFSGGVDSTTGAALLASVLGKQLYGLCLDFGQLREGEDMEISAHARAAGLSLTSYTDRGGVLQVALAGERGDCEIAEWKRKGFSQLYGKNFEHAGKECVARYVIQLSLATDFIESSKAGASALIKSHHNTIAEFGSLKPVHPFRHLFKYEVRELAKELGLPESVVNRQPFPGPGLLVRWVGGIPTPENLALLQWVDARVREVLETAGEYQKISQLVVAIPALRVTGVKGDGRAYRYPVWIRAVESSDFMTARGYRICPETQEKLESVLTAHRDIVAVSYWPTSKPPETVEFE